MSSLFSFLKCKRVFEWISRQRKSEKLLRIMTFPSINFLSSNGKFMLQIALRLFFFVSFIFCLIFHLQIFIIIVTSWYDKMTIAGTMCEYRSSFGVINQSYRWYDLLTENSLQFVWSEIKRKRRKNQNKKKRKSKPTSKITSAFVSVFDAHPIFFDLNWFRLIFEIQFPALLFFSFFSSA